MERIDGRPTIFDSSMVKSLVLVISMLTASGEIAAVAQTANPDRERLSNTPDVARIEPEIKMETVLLESGNL